LSRFDVTVVGEINLDLILYGLPEQLPQERELIANRLNLTLGSSSAIVAHNLAALGNSVGFITRVGADYLGNFALARLRERGVDLTKVVTDQNSSTGLSVILPHERKRHIFTYPGTMFDMALRDLDFNYLNSARHFHMSSLFLHKGLTADIPALFARMKKAGLTTSLDTNDDPEDCWEGVLELLRYVDVFLPNEREACRIAGTENLEQAVDILAARVPVLAVKLGARGALGRRGVEAVTVQSIPVDVLDPVGAGDSFDAGFLSTYIKGGSLRECLENGNIAGALSTQRSGGAEAFRDDDLVRTFFARHRSEDLEPSELP
jgi:sugar/nucleoside kinase (ribokinase family)